VGLFDLFRSGQPEPKKAKETSGVRVSSKEKCSNCGRPFGEQRIYYTYPGKTKGDLEITEERRLCRDCLEKKYDTNDAKQDAKKNAEIVMALQLKDKVKLNKALKELDKDGQKDDPSYWYNRANIQSNIQNMEEALKSYDEALFLDTHYIKAWYRKAGILFSLKKIQEADICLENVLILEVWLKETIDKFEGMESKAEMDNASVEIWRKLKDGKEKGWSIAALILQTYAMMSYANSKGGKIPEKEGKRVKNRLLMVYIILNSYKGISLPVVQGNNYFSIVFPDFIFSNAANLIKMTEPNVVAQVRLAWEKH
jgi:tetratricopeptide (TPR) repeat protein